MFSYKNRYSILFKAIATALVCLLLVNDVSWAITSSYNLPQQTTLAAWSRFESFSDAKRLDPKAVFLAFMAAGKLRDLMISEKMRKGQIFSRIEFLNQLFNSKSVKVQIAEEVGSREFNHGTKSYRYLTFNFEQEGKIVSIEARFIKDHDKLTADERIELGVKTEKDEDYFNSVDYPSLAGVWFVDCTLTLREKPSESAQIVVPQSIPALKSTSGPDRQWNSEANSETIPDGGRQRLPQGRRSGDSIVMRAEPSAFHFVEGDFLGVPEQFGTGSLSGSSMSAFGYHGYINSTAGRHDGEEGVLAGNAPKAVHEAIENIARYCLQEIENKGFSRNEAIFIFNELVQITDRFLGEKAKPGELLQVIGNRISKLNLSKEYYLYSTVMIGESLILLVLIWWTHFLPDLTITFTAIVSSFILLECVYLFCKNEIKLLEEIASGGTIVLPSPGLRDGWSSRLERSIFPGRGANFYAFHELRRMENGKSSIRSSIQRSLDTAYSIADVERILNKQGSTIERYKFILKTVLFLPQSFWQFFVTDKLRGRWLAQAILLLSGNDYKKAYEALQQMALGKSLSDIFKDSDLWRSSNTGTAINSPQAAPVKTEPPTDTRVGHNEHRGNTNEQVSLPREEKTSAIEPFPGMDMLPGSENLLPDLEIPGQPKDLKQDLPPGSRGFAKRRKDPGEAASRLSTTGDVSFKLAADEADSIDKANLEFRPSEKDVSEKTIICEVIADSTVPAGQRRMIQEIGQEMAKPKNNYIERIACLEDKGPDNFMDNLREVIAKQERLKPGSEIEYYVACARKSDVETILGNVPNLEREFGRKLTIKAIAFESPELDVNGVQVNAVQVHAIMLALRALRKGPESLREAYKLLTGKDLKDENGNDITDLVEMMKKALFKVPPAKIDIDKVDGFNRLVEKYILDAA